MEIHSTSKCDIIIVLHNKKVVCDDTTIIIRPSLYLQSKCTNYVRGSIIMCVCVDHITTYNKESVVILYISSLYIFYVLIMYVCIMCVCCRSRYNNI